MLLVVGLAFFSHSLTALAQNQGFGGTGGTSGSFGSGNLTFSGTFSGTENAGVSGLRFSGGTVVGVSETNPFRTYYANPYSVGVSTTFGSTGMTTSNASFGQPIFEGLATTGTTPTGTTAITGTTGSTGITNTTVGSGLTTTGGPTGNPSSTFPVVNVTSSSATPTSGYTGGGGFSTTGMYRNPVYVTGLGYTLRPTPMAPDKLQAKVHGIIQRSSALPSKQRIQVKVEGNTVVLMGKVADFREQKMAESLVRLTPGVRSVRNELIVEGE